MANYLLDTTVIIDCLRGRKEVVEFLTELASEGLIVGCCAINIAEVYAGMRENERQVTRRFLDSLEYYEVTRNLAELAGEYKREYAVKGITLSLSDVIIAAVTISNNLTLVTDNLRHYPMPELNIKQIEASMLLITVKPAYLRYKYIHIPQEYRSQLPGFKIPFELETDRGVFQVYIGDANLPANLSQGSMQSKNAEIRRLGEWFRAHPELKVEDKLIIEVIEPMKRYRLKIA